MAETSIPDEVIRVRIDNRWARFDCDPDIQPILKTYFRYEVPGAKFSRQFKDGIWDGFHNLMQYGRVAPGLFYHRLADMEADGLRFEIAANVEPIPLTKPGWLPHTRRYQKQAVVALATSAGGILLAATGSGKTFIVGELFRRVDAPCCMIADELTLLEQTRRSLAETTGEEIGVIGRGRADIRRVNVATIQTLHRHALDPAFKSWINNVVLVIDELQVSLNKRMHITVNRLKPRAVFGATGSLETLKEPVRMESLAMCGPVLYEYSLMQGQEEGVLSDGVACCVGVTQPSKGYADWQMSYRMLITKSVYRNRVIEALVREGLKRGRRIVLLGERIRHLDILSKRLEDIPHVVVSGHHGSKDDRLSAQERMQAGKLSLIITNRVFAKGIDIPNLDMTIDATGGFDGNSSRQRFGRGTRTAEGKAGLLHFDIADIGNPFAAAADNRRAALSGSGVKIVECYWEGSAAEVFKRAESGLNTARAVA